MDTISVYASGQWVKVGTSDDPLNALIIKAIIGAQEVSYRVAIYDGRQRYTTTVSSAEIVEGCEERRIGFKANGK